MNEDSAPHVGDIFATLKFDPAGTHDRIIIDRLKAIGKASYEREKKDQEGLGGLNWPLHDQEVGFAAAEAVIWLEKQYRMRFNELLEAAKDLVDDIDAETMLGDMPRPFADRLRAAIEALK